MVWALLSTALWNDLPFFAIALFFLAAFSSGIYARYFVKCPQCGKAIGSAAQNYMLRLRKPKFPVFCAWCGVDFEKGVDKADVQA